MKNFVKPLVFSLGLSIAAANTWAASITAVRSWRAPDNTRIVLDLSEQVLYRQINTNNSKQIIIELDNTDAAVSTLALPSRVGLVQNVLLESVGSKQRLIINLSDDVKPKVFMLAANEKLSSRLVIDLYDKVVMQAVSTPVIEEETPSSQQRDNDGRPIIVVVDAGHGGEDSGAIGATGNYEKHVTLAIAKKLVAILRKQQGFKAYLTRDGDYFIPLIERRKIARNKYKADIFISVHADAALSPLAKGASVFALSRKGANSATSRFAQAIADRENKSDLIGGVDNSVSKDSQLTNILADMVVEGSMTHGLNMGSEILKELGGLTKLHSKQVEQAGFAVLKEAGMISLLVETGFITNATEESNLINQDYQQQMAQAIFDGVHRFVNKYPISQTYFAWHKEQRTSKQKRRALEEVGAPAPKVVPATEKLIDKPLEKTVNKPVALSAKPDNAALIASFTQDKQPNTKPDVPVLKAEPSPSKPAVKATLPTSLDDFMVEAKTIKKTPPVTPKIEPKIEPKVVVKAEPKAKIVAPILTTHTVKKGDTLSTLSAHYQLNPEDVKKWNNLGTDNVVLGQKLLLKEPVVAAKAKTPPPAKLSSHKVKAGDSLSSIAIKYGVSMQALRDANHLKDDNVLLDTTLKIPKP